MSETAPDMGISLILPPSGVGSPESQQMFLEKISGNPMQPTPEPRAVRTAANEEIVDAIFAAEREGRWKAQARCRETATDSSLFYHPTGERGIVKQNRDAQAIEVCQQCPVRTLCLAGAIDRRETFGVWGGPTEDQREGAFDEAARFLGRNATDAQVNRFVFAGFAQLPELNKR